MTVLFAALFNLAHTFTHRVMHPLVFGCCATDHPQQNIRAEWFSPLWWMRRMEEHFQIVREVGNRMKDPEAKK